MTAALRLGPEAAPQSRRDLVRNLAVGHRAVCQVEGSTPAADDRGSLEKAWKLATKHARQRLISCVVGQYRGVQLPSCQPLDQTVVRNQQAASRFGACSEETVADGSREEPISPRLVDVGDPLP